MHTFSVEVNSAFLFPLFYCKQIFFVWSVTATFSTFLLFVGEFPFCWWFKGPREIVLKFSIVYLTTRRLMCLTEKLCVLDKLHSGTN